MAISVVSFSFSWCSTGRPGAQLSGECWLSLPHLVSNSSDLQLTDFLSSPSYIIIQSPNQYLWNGMFDRHQAEITVMQVMQVTLFRCIYDYTMVFYLLPYCQPSPPTRFLPITDIGMCHFLPVHHFGMAWLAGSKVNIQHSEQRFASCDIDLRSK